MKMLNMLYQLIAFPPSESDGIVGLVHGEGVPINHMCYFN